MYLTEGLSMKYMKQYQSNLEQVQNKLAGSRQKQLLSCNGDVAVSNTEHVSDD